jgi:hypothetical protein
MFAVISLYRTCNSEILVYTVCKYLYYITPPKHLNQSSREQVAAALLTGQFYQGLVNQNAPPPPIEILPRRTIRTISVVIMVSEPLPGWPAFHLRLPVACFPRLFRRQAFLICYQAHMQCTHTPPPHTPPSGDIHK